MSELVSEFVPNVRLVRIGTEDKVIKTVGTRSYLRKVLELDAEGICQKILNRLK